MNCVSQIARKENKFYEVTGNSVPVEKAVFKDKVIVSFTASSNIMSIELHRGDLEQLNESRGYKRMKLVKNEESKLYFCPSWSLEFGESLRVK